MNNGNRDRQFEGFTLLEILLTLGILLIIGTLVLPITLQRSQESKLKVYANQLVTDIYYQQQRSSLKGIPSGIAINNNGYTLFDGESFSTASETQIKTYPANISITNVNLTLGNEILFPEGKFKPSIYGTLVITDGQSSISIYINREGLMGYEIL